MFYLRASVLLLALIPVALANPQSHSPSSSSSSSSTSSSSSSSSGASEPAGLSERELFGSVSYDQFAQGYGNGGGNGAKVERVDEPVRELPVVQENQQGQEQFVDHQFPEERRDGQVNVNKEIHSYTVQRKITNVNNRVVHRYLKNLLINTLYNTNVQRIRHQKLVNLLVNTLQEVHQPKLFVKFSRKDNVQDAGESNAQPEVSEERKDNVLPPVYLPATAEKVGYNGEPLGAGVGVAGATPGTASL